ncbi:MAG: DUF1351 domain-containing protein [Clostridia bacterium]|nr:DUF1351 domain-containing protein [Clostridia bacterium]
MELKTSEVQEIAPVTFNFEELKKELTEKSKYYATAVYTEDTITTAKQDRANLNKLVKAVDDEKKRVKNIIMKPYTTFETQCKELMEIVKNAVENIDSQIKSFEDKKKQEKIQQVIQYFFDHVGIYDGLINFDIIYNDRWENVTYEMKTIQQEIDHIIAKAKTDLMVINSNVINEETNKQVTDFYFKNINKSDCLGLALNEAKTIEATKSRITEMKKQEEKKATAEQAKQTIIPESEQSKEKMQLYELRFKVAVTKEQMSMLKEFFISNKIRFERI